MSHLEAANNNSAWIEAGESPTRFVLLRHGVTEYSLAKRFAGRSDLELTELGHQQAGLAAVRVAELGPIDVLVSSPLRRTRQTAERVAELLQLEPVFDDDVIETDFGDWDGYSFDEAGQKWPAELTRYLVDPAAAPPGGESAEAVGQRVARARDRLIERYPGRTLLVVTHVSPIKTLVAQALRAPATAVHRMYLAPASVTVIDFYAGGAASLRSFNDTAHLSAG